jgi:hypothetical protein
MRTASGERENLIPKRMGPSDKPLQLVKGSNNYYISVIYGGYLLKWNCIGDIYTDTQVSH